jgi:hypothetical protein
MEICMQKISIALTTLSIFMTHSALAAGFPEALGFSASMEAVAQVLSSPALPSLDNEGLSATPLFGTVQMEGVDETVTLMNGTSATYTNRGELKGDVAGLTLNYSGNGDLGFFLTTAWAQVGGDMRSTILSSTFDVRDISAESYVGAIGAQYRVVGTAKSSFAMGIFGGPAYISSKTSEHFIQSNGSTTKVELDPQLQAFYFGLQMMIRFKEFRINPYLNVLESSNKTCQLPSYTGDPYPLAQYNICQNGDHGIDTMTALAGTGVNVGYGRFQIGLLQFGGSTTQSLKATRLMFSYRIGL